MSDSPVSDMVFATEESTSPVFTAYGRIARMRCWARVRRAPATIFMARVIFCVAFVLAMRLRITLSDGMARSVLPVGGLGRAEGRGELLERLLEGGLGRVV